MDILVTFGTAVVGGLVVVGGWLLVMGRKFQILDDLKKKADSIETLGIVLRDAVMKKTKFQDNF